MSPQLSETRGVGVCHRDSRCCQPAPTINLLSCIQVRLVVTPSHGHWLSGPPIVDPGLLHHMQAEFREGSGLL
jgi:hypothetical protein